MGKRKRNGPPKSDHGPASEFEDKRGSMLNIRSFEDVANAEDEFHLGRDKIALEGPPKSKRQRQDEEDEAFLEVSDNDVIAGPSDDSDSVDEEEDDVAEPDLDPDPGADLAESEEDETNWGADRSAYYNTDDITNEDDALNEALEATRIRQKLLPGISEADFGGDSDWVRDGAAADDSEDDDARGAHVKDKLRQIENTPGMSNEGKLAFLHDYYPEFEDFAHDLVRLEPEARQMQTEYKNAQADGTPLSAVLLAQIRALSAYLGALSMYFAILTSPAQADGPVDQVFSLPPDDLRDLGLLDSIHKAKDQWERVQNLEDDVDEQIFDEDAVEDEPVVDGDTAADEVDDMSDASEAAAPIPPPSSRKAAALARTEASLAELDRQLAQNAQSRRKNAPAATRPNGLPTADLGDEEPLTAEQAAEKAHKRKSLRFYTSQIAQRQNKRDGAAARAAQGDDDLPYRERWRDRMERLTREAEARGRAAPAADDDMDDDDGDDAGATNAERGAAGDDADYAELLGAAARKKAARATREAAHQAARAVGGRAQAVVEPADGSGRREIGWAIAANKGLTPKRNRANKNPRVKKRRKFEDKTKKLRSMKPTFRGGEGRGGYAGEMTGIKKGNVRAVKL